MPGNSQQISPPLTPDLKLFNLCKVHCLFKFSPAQTCVPGQKPPLSCIAQLSPPPTTVPEEAELRQNLMLPKQGGKIGGFDKLNKDQTYQ